MARRKSAYDREVNTRRTKAVIVDTREKKPWTFKQQTSKKLNVGDYTIQGGKTKVLIERKGSIYDLYATFRPKNRERFMRNMEQAVKKVDNVFLLLETSLAAVYRGVRENPVPPHVVIEHLLQLMEMGIRVLYTGGAKNSGRDFIDRILYRFGSM